MINKKEIGSIIQRARINLRMTQEQLAEAAGISANYLSKVERGLNSPSAENFLKIIKELNLSLDNFGINLVPEKNNDKKEIFTIINNCTNQELTALLPVIKALFISFNKLKSKSLS